MAKAFFAAVTFGGIASLGLVVFLLAMCLRRRASRSRERMSRTIRRSPSMAAFEVSLAEVRRRPVLGVEQEFPHDALCTLKTIGEGDFAKLFKGEALGLQQSDTATTVLVKTLSSTSPKSVRDKFTLEMEVFSRMDHPNILPLLAICSETDPACMLFEYSELEDLKSYLQDAGQVSASGGNSSMFAMLRTADLSNMAVDVIAAVDYLQSQSMCHTDIAARHCQVMAGGRVKLAPFQFIVPTKYQDDYCVVGDYERTDGFRGARVLPVRWMAPESLADGHFSVQSDLWSLGVTLWEIFSLGVSPYRGFSNDEVMDQVPRSQLLLATPPRCPSSLWKVLRCCLVSDPSKRMPADALLQKVKQLHTSIAQNNVLLDLATLEDADVGTSDERPLTPIRSHDGLL